MSTGLIIFFVLTTIIGVAIAIISDVESLSAKFLAIFKTENDN